LGSLNAPAAVPALAGFARQPDREVHEAALAALASIGDESALNAVAPLLEDPSTEVRRAALAALGQFKSRTALPHLREAYQDAALRTEATAGLTQRPDARSLGAYLDGLASRNATLREKSRKALAAIQVEALPQIEAKLASLNSDVVAAPAKTLEAGDYLAFALTNPGDATRGKGLFNDPAGVACGKCHRVSGEGGDIGPDLSGIGAQFSREQLAESILFPSRAVRGCYNQVTVETKDEEEISGLVRAETNEHLTLRPADGRDQRIAKSQIKRRTNSELSLLPDGLHAVLSLQEFADLLAFLETLKTGMPAKD
jgi:putative heme-binding domain-containing protein